jgi:hypothetical protein
MSAPQSSRFALPAASILAGALAILAIALSRFISGPLILVVVAAFLIAFILSLTLVARAAPRSFGRAAARVLVSLAGAVALGYLLLFAIVLFGQDAIADRTNAFFQPRGLSEAAAVQFDVPDEMLEIPTSDGAVLRGWLARGSAAGKQPLVIYFGGSGSESSDAVAHARMLAPWSVALVNYRGFGASTGRPTPANARGDALLIYDTLVQRGDVDPTQVAVVGYSLGTGVAVHVAEARPTVAVALFAPYDSLKLVQPGASPLYAPFQSMMKPYFTPIASAPNIQASMLAIVGGEDNVFPAEMSWRLAEAWGGPAAVRVYDGEGHTLSERNDASWREVAGFLARAAGRAE